jgi:hypothetical protein
MATVAPSCPDRSRCGSAGRRAEGIVMLRLRVHGAARTVTGSCFLIETEQARGGFVTHERPRAHGSGWHSPGFTPRWSRSARLEQPQP